MTVRLKYTMSFDHIRNLITNELISVDEEIRRQLHSSVPLIPQIAEHIITGGGKRLRPVLALLVAKALGQCSQKTVTAAAIIELIHTATLLHDDVVDHSDLRRGLATANALWGNAASVLVGDFLYSRSFEMMVSLNDMKIMEVLARTTNRIAQGEVLQLSHVRDPDITEATYFEIIHCKTAVLFRAASFLGALSSGATIEVCEQLGEYGLNLGVAFQLMDDALDYIDLNNSDALGKNRGDDLAEGKPTLPLIYALSQSDATQKIFLRETILKGEKENFDEVLTLIQNTGALTYLKDTALDHMRKAIDCLAPLPDSPHKTALKNLAHFAVERCY